MTASHLQPSVITPSPNAEHLLQERGGGGVYTGTYGTAPPSPIYAKHTTINGSRPGFIVVCVIAGLLFIALLSGGGYFWFWKRRRGRFSTKSSTKRRSGTFRAEAGSHSNTNRGAWRTLDDEADDDAFAMPLGPDSTNVSMLDLNDHATNSYGQGHNLLKTWNPVYAASGDSITWQDHKENPVSATPAPR